MLEFMKCLRLKSFTSHYKYPHTHSFSDRSRSISLRIAQLSAISRLAKFLRSVMGIHMCKRASSSNQTISNLHYTADHLSSYEAACKIDIDMQSFDTTLQTRTTGVIHSLADGVEVKSLSFDSLKQTTECLLELNQEVVKVILDCKKDIWGNQELFELVEEYFDNSLKTLDFCAALEKCLKHARDAHLLIKVALQRFEENPNNRERFVEELKRFKDCGDPFNDEFFQVFHSVYLRQIQMLEKLGLKKTKLDKKLKHIKSWRRISGAIFAAAFAAVLICAVVAAAVAAPPVAAALAAATSIPVGSMGKWIDLLVRNYERAVRGQKEVVNYMSVGTRVVIKDLENIRAVVERVAAEVEAVVEGVDFASGESEGGGFEIAVGEIRRSLGVFMENVEELGVQANNCSRDIRMARTVILQRIIKHPQN